MYSFWECVGESLIACAQACVSALAQLSASALLTQIQLRHAHIHSFGFFLFIKFDATITNHTQIHTMSFDLQHKFCTIMCRQSKASSSPTTFCLLMMLLYSKRFVCSSDCCYTAVIKHLHTQTNRNEFLIHSICKLSLSFLLFLSLSFSVNKRFLCVRIMCFFRSQTST